MAEPLTAVLSFTTTPCLVTVWNSSSRLRLYFTGLPVFMASIATMGSSLL